MKPNLFREFVTALLCGLLLLQSVQAAAPGWWSAQGVIAPNKPADDYAALNQGQLKLLASKAWLQMELSLPGGAGPELTQLVSGWRLSRPQTDDFAVVNVGQLKNVAKPFYERLSGAGLASLPAWMTQPGGDDFAAVNLGQAKLLFGFTLPQAAGNAPQRLSGNGMTGMGLPPGFTSWGGGPPAPGAVLPQRYAKPAPAQTTEISNTPSTPVDLDAPPVIRLFTLERAEAQGSVSKVDDFEGHGIAVGWASGEWREVSSTGALSGALADLSDFSLGHTTQTFSGQYPEWPLSNLHSGYLRTVYEDEGVEPSVGEHWFGEQEQFRIFSSGGQNGASAPQQAWLRIERNVWNQIEGVPAGVSVELQPFQIADSRENAPVVTVASRHWEGSGLYESVNVSLVLPQFLQVNDGDVDGDNVPDYADGQDEGAAQEEAAELPQTRMLESLNSGAASSAARVRFLYSASDPNAVTQADGPQDEPVYQPAPGALRLWREQIFEPGHTENRDPRSAAAGGDFIPPGVWFDAYSLGSLFVESVRPSTQMHDQTVVVECDQDGDGPEQAYAVKHYFFTSIGTQLEEVKNGVIGQRALRMQPSLPNPTIDLQNVSVTNARMSADGSGLLADIAFSGKVRSAVCDLTPGEETGAIHSAYASVNDEPLPQSAVTVTVSKQDTPAGQDRPYPYEGTFSHTLTGVKVTEGKNTLGLIVSDPLYHLSGTAEVGFEIDATPPGGAGGAFASETAVTLELPVAGSTLAADEARLSVETQEATLANGVILKRQTGNALLYRSTDGQAVFQFTQAPTLTTTTAEAVHGFITLPQAGWAGAAFSPMTETDVNSGAFVWSAQEEFAGYWGWSVSAGPVDAAVESGVGEFHAYTVRLVGPQTLLEQVGRVHLAGVSLPVLVQNGIARLADALHPGQPATIATLPMESRQAAYLPEEEENEVSPGLAELGIGENWEEQDLPETFYEGEGSWGAKGRKASVQAPENGMSLTQRLQRQAGIWWDDHTSTGYYKGFVTGFFDNPYTTGKDAVASVVGISEKAANVLWLTSPLRTVWEFTYGDAYQGEIQTAIRAGQRAKEIGGQTYQVLKEWGPEVWDFLWKLNFQANETVVRSALLGEFPSKERMGPELRLALELLEQILIMADDAWVDMGAYQRGYWQGYITFEIVAVVVLAVATAPEGAVGGAAALARHAPKVTRLYQFLDKLLDRLDDIPALANLVNKLRGFKIIADKLGDFCFVAGTPVLTLRGMRPIEQIKEQDWVWSRDDETGEWGWRPVVRTFTTHPDTLVHVRYAAQGGEADMAASEGLGLTRQLIDKQGEAEFSSTPGHLVHARRKAGGIMAAFVAAGSLTAGDLLTLADGRDAAVSDVRVEHAAPGTTFTTYNFTVAGHHTYFVGELPVWVHNDGLDDCGKLGERLVKIIAKKGDDPARYFEYLKEARVAISGTIKSDRIWGNGYKKMTQKMVDAFEKGEITDVDAIPTYNQLKASFSGSTTVRKLKQADTDIHHIVPKHALKALRGMDGGLPDDHSLGDVAAVALSKADHRKISNAMNPFLKSPGFQNLGTASEKALAIVNWYRDNGYSGQQKIAAAWFKKRGIL